MPNAKITYIKVNALASYSSPRSIVTYTNLKLEALLDADTKNRYFRLEGFTVDDSASFTTNKSLQDSILGFTDSVSAAVTKKAADTLSFSDVADVVLTIQRTFFDAPILFDNTAIAVGRSEVDALTPADASSYVVTKNLSDTLAAIADASYLTTTKGVADTLSAADTFTRAVTFSRNFSDAFALDDFTDVNALQKSTIASKTNTFGFSDNQAFATEKELSDAASVADSVNVQLRSLASSVLNTTAMNVATLNN